MRPIYRSITVVLPVAAGAGTLGNKLPFPDVPQLRENGIRCYGFNVFDVTMMAATLNPAGPVITAADSTAVLITLVEKSNQRFQRIPWDNFNQQANFGNWFESVPFYWQPTQSFVEFTAATAGTAFNIPMVVYYSTPKDRLDNP